MQHAEQAGLAQEWAARTQFRAFLMWKVARNRKRAAFGAARWQTIEKLTDWPLLDFGSALRGRAPVRQVIAAVTVGAAIVLAARLTVVAGVAIRIVV